jgi:hypothetical protein
MTSFQGIAGRADGTIEFLKTAWSVLPDAVLMIEGGKGCGKRRRQKNAPFDAGSRTRTVKNYFPDKQSGFC